MPYYDPLRAIWLTLTGTTDKKLAAINALTVPGPKQPVQIAAVMTYLRSNGLWLAIKKAAADGTSIGAEAAVDLNSDMRVQTIDFDLPLVGQMLADMVSKGLLKQEHVDALNELAAPPVPWWQASVAQGGGGLSSPVGLNDLAIAGGLS